MTNTTDSKTRAQRALTSADEFCRLIGAARNHKFPGYWEGSAFRCHPCGVIEGAIKLTNHWHVDQHCDIVISNGDGWTRPCDDSFSHGDPHPHPTNGGEVTVWRCGRWASEEFRAALEPKVSALLERIEAHVKEREDAAATAEAARYASVLAAQQALIQSALAKASV